MTPRAPPPIHPDQIEHTEFPLAACQPDWEHVVDGKTPPSRRPDRDQGRRLSLGESKSELESLSHWRTPS
eukprot:1469531-Rhodomonas_salina.1